MKAFNLIKWILIIMSITFTYDLLAQPFAGGSITYTCQGGTSYEVRYTFYWDCSGCAAPNTVPLQFTCSSNPGFNFNATATKLAGTGTIVSPNHSLASSHCNGGNNYGIKEYVYTALVNLPPCENWLISNPYGGCRGPLTTTQNPGVYIYASLNNLKAPCNSSPVFTNSPLIVVSKDQTIRYNPGLVDADGDSLTYSFVKSRLTNSTFSTYLGAYNENNFLNSSIPISIDSIYGDMRMKPSANLLTLYVIKVDEWRKVNGVPTCIGTVIRDMNLKVDYSISNNPELSGITTDLNSSYSVDDTIYHINACVNSNIQLRINAYDPDTFNSAITGSPEKFKLSWNNGIPAGIFQSYHNDSDSAYATFSWTPLQADSGKTKCFTVKVQDFAAPYNAIGIYSYCVSITTQKVDLGQDVSICENDQLVIKAQAENAAKHYNWYVDGVLSSPLNSTIDSFIISGLTAGQHSIKVEVDNGMTNVSCPGSEEILLDVLPIPIFNLGSDTMIKPSAALPLNGPIGMQSYLWNTGNSTSFIVATQSNAGWENTYWLQVEDANGCLGSDSIRIIFSTVGIEEQTDLNTQIYPLPVKDYLHIEQEEVKMEKLRLYTANGLLVKEIDLTGHLTKVDLHELASGMYILRSMDGNGFIKKIIKQ